MTGDERDRLMQQMRNDFVPREVVEINLGHIASELKTIKDGLKTLPDELEKKLNERWGGRITKLEREVEELKKFRWKAAGALLAVEVIIGVLFEIFWKH